MKNPIPMKERVKIPRQRMPEQAPLERSHNFDEVNLGLAAATAASEASRCIECADPKCSKGCPVGVKVREFVDLVLSGDYKAAAAKMREDNVLPAVTGRVCPQEDQCEGACLMGKKWGSLAIGYLERFIADWEMGSGEVGLPPRAPLTGKKVACVGSGPASLTAAGDLVQKGHEVTVFEALHEIGGVLVYGIPEFRLPKEIVRREVENMKRMGVRFETNVVVGRTVTIDELMNGEGYHAVFVATGAGLPKFLGVPGENLNGVYSANEFLSRVNLMKAYRFPEYDEPIFDCRGKNVAVIGGGNTALDAIRTALRLGATKAMMLYRRSEAEMPGRAEEIHHAKDEGISIHTLTHPVEFLGDERGWLKAARCIRMELGEPDESGRRRPVPVAGSEFEIPLDVAIVAVGTGPNPLVQSTTPDLATNKKGYIAVGDQETLRTSKKGVFAGGDIVTGAATVILAMGAGRKAARSIDEYLKTGAW
ncbi:MAG TPA: NADPH-dependent glutamate synthase [Vicinamibacteria bacterium]|nr:NADPH-dependent glutamate synthase [Vicinamibacteria bacterium]